MKNLITALALVVLVSSSVPQAQAKDHPKRRALITKVGRAIGTGSTVATRAMLKQYVFAAAWVRGLVGNAKRQESSLALIDLLLEDQNLKRLNDVTAKSTSFKQYTEDMVDEVEDIVTEEIDRVWVSVLHDADPKVDVTKKLKEIDLEKVDLSKLNAKLLEKNPGYVRLKNLVGKLDDEQVIDAATDIFSDVKIPTTQEVLDQIVLAKTDVKDVVPEAAGVVVGRAVIVPLLLKHTLGSAVLHAYNWITLPALVGTGISAWQCLRPQTQIRINDDTPSTEDLNTKELQNFCRNVLNQSAFKILKSRAKGLRSGHKFQAWLKRVF